MEDSDAALIVQFENSLMDTLQEDKGLSAFYTDYLEARRRLNERFKSRGFWGPSQKGKEDSERKADSRAREKAKEPNP